MILWCTHLQTYPALPGILLIIYGLAILDNSFPSPSLSSASSYMLMPHCLVYLSACHLQSLLFNSSNNPYAIHHPVEGCLCSKHRLHFQTAPLSHNLEPHFFLLYFNCISSSQDNPIGGYCHGRRVSSCHGKL
jgi:hypothetical protein